MYNAPDKTFTVLERWAFLTIGTVLIQGLTSLEPPGNPPCPPVFSALVFENDPRRQQILLVQLPRFFNASQIQNTFAIGFLPTPDTEDQASTRLMTQSS